MATAYRHGVHYTYAEYLALEATSNVKHEYLDLAGLPVLIV